MSAKGKQAGAWQLILSSLRGEEHDFTEGSIHRAVILLAIPMILEMMMESVFAVVDIFFVNRLGPDATSVVGLTESVITLVYSMGIGLSAAATAMVARRTGEKNRAAAAEAGKQAVFIGILVTLLVSVPGVLFSRTILSWMGAEPQAIDNGVGYTRTLFGSSLFILLLFLINGIFRGAGNAAIAMKSLWLANIINIILDPLLIFGYGPFPELGLQGAAIATTIGRATGVVYQLYHLRKGQLHIRYLPIRMQWPIVKGLLAIAWPATFQFIIASASWIILAAMVATFGSEASAGYQTAIRILIFFILPAWGLSNAAATLVGQNLGAGSPQRAEKSVVVTATYNVIFMAVVTVFFLLFSPPVIRFFIPDTGSDQFSYALDALQIVSAGYIFYGIGMVVTQAFNGAGDSRTPTVINFVCFWLLQVPLAWFFLQKGWFGVHGVFAAIPVAETLIAVISLILFRRGKWKATAV